MRVPLYEHTPWCVLLENSDHESEAHARASSSACWKPALEQGCVTDAVVAESLAQAQASCGRSARTFRWRRPMEGLNIKHDISIPDLAHSRVRARATDALLHGAIPGVRLVNFGHLGDGNLHYNVQAPEGGDGSRLSARARGRSTRWCSSRWTRFGGSISAEHGIGSLKVDKLPGTSHRWRWR
jgi:FAD/FMN-containing dehydrogenase